MPKASAGILLYRRAADHGPAEIEVLIGHMGGPFWAGKDDGAWSIPKGEIDDDAGTDPAAAYRTARREFAEETGSPVPDGPALDVGVHRYRSGKTIAVWAVEGDLDAARAVSNTFAIEWPPRSGRQQEFPELDRFAWVGLAAAALKLVTGQRPILDALVARLAASE